MCIECTKHHKRALTTRGHLLEPIDDVVGKKEKEVFSSPPPPPKGAPPPAQVKLEPGAPGPAQGPGRVHVINLMDSDDEDVAPAPASTTTAPASTTTSYW